MKQWHISLTLVLAIMLSFIACDSSELKPRNFRNNAATSNSEDVSSNTRNCDAQARSDDANCDPRTTIRGVTDTQSNPTPPPPATAEHLETNTDAINNDDSENSDNTDVSGDSETHENPAIDSNSDAQTNTETNNNSNTQDPPPNVENTDSSDTSTSSETDKSTFVMMLSSNPIGSSFMAITATSDGGFLAAGTTTNPVTMHGIGLIVRLDASGTLQWKRTFEGLGGFESRFQFILRTQDDHFVVLTRYSILKLTGQGALIWKRRIIGKPNLESVIETGDNGFVLSGQFVNAAGVKHAGLVKIDQSGNYLWSKEIRAGTYSQFKAVIETEDGGFIAGGMVRVPGYNRGEILIVKISNRGAIVWEIMLGDSLSDSIKSIVQTNDGHYVLAGGSDKIGCFLMKIKPSGEIRWTRTYKDSGIIDFRGLTATPDNGVVVIGRGSTSMKSGRPYLTRTFGIAIRVDAAGSNIWARALEGTLDKGEYFNGISNLKNGGYIISAVAYYPRTPTNLIPQGLFVSISSKGDLGGKGSKWFSSHNSYIANISTEDKLEEVDYPTAIFDLPLEIDANSDSVIIKDAADFTTTFIR